MLRLRTLPPFVCCRPEDEFHQTVQLCVDLVCSSTRPRMSRLRVAGCHRGRRCARRRGCYWRPRAGEDFWPPARTARAPSRSRRARSASRAYRMTFKFCVAYLQDRFECPAILQLRGGFQSIRGRSPSWRCLHGGGSKTVHGFHGVCPTRVLIQSASPRGVGRVRRGAAARRGAARGRSADPAGARARLVGQLALLDVRAGPQPGL